MTSTVPFLDLKRLNSHLQNALDDAYHRVMASGWYVLGEEGRAFEADFASYCNVKHCLGVGNGLDAISLLLRAYDIGVGDEVIVPSNTFIATWFAVSQCGATPVPVEPNPATYNIEATAIEAAITANTRAVIPVHLYGQPADMAPIMQLAQQRGLVVIEDAAQAQGARYQGRKVGSLGHAAATSFYPGKNLGALGDGGAVLTNDDVIADKVNKLRNYGSKVRYQHEAMGINSRLDELQAAFLRVKLLHLDAWNASRTKLVQRYCEQLAQQELVLPLVPAYADPVWHLFVVRSKKRDALRQHLDNLGIQTGIHYPTPPHQQACYATAIKVALPITTQLSQEILSLPMSPDMTAEEVDTVCNAIKFFAH